MTVFVVGGHARNVGKTSVTAGLIHAFKEYSWTALKISSHPHLATPAKHELREGFAEVFEETNRDGSSDTSRFLAAGAARSLWLQMGSDSCEDTLRRLRPILDSSSFLIIESNRVLRVIQPDLCLMVLRYDIKEFKASARDALRQTHAVVAINANFALPPWTGVPEILSAIPQFITPDPQIIPEGLLEFIRSRLQRSGLH